MAKAFTLSVPGVLWAAASRGFGWTQCLLWKLNDRTDFLGVFVTMKKMLTVATADLLLLSSLLELGIQAERQHLLEGF